MDAKAGGDDVTGQADHTRVTNVLQSPGRTAVQPNCFEAVSLLRKPQDPSPSCDCVFFTSSLT